MNICLIGDSWGRGEWGHESGVYKVLHPGIEHFLKQKHLVLNLSNGATSIEYAISQLKCSLEHNNFDYIFWFKTDPLRNLSSHQLFNNKQVSFEDLITENYNQTKYSYTELNNLGVPIHCIGGCGKLNLDLMSSFTNLVPYIESLPTWLEPEFEHPEIWVSNWINLVDKQFDLDSLDKLLNCKKEQDKLFQYKKYFWPDGRHMNRLGHEILFNKICKDFKL